MEYDPRCLQQLPATPLKWPPEVASLLMARAQSGRMVLVTSLGKGRFCSGARQLKTKE